MRVLLRAMRNSSNTSCRITCPNQEEIQESQLLLQQNRVCGGSLRKYLVLLMAVVCDVPLIPNRTCKMRIGRDLRNQVRSQTSLFRIFEAS